MKFKDIKVIGFDADDTLWENENHYQQTEHLYCELLKDYLPKEKLSKVLFEVEMRNLNLYGYGAKAFLLSLIETAIQVSNMQIHATTMQEIINLGKNLINTPVILLEGVTYVLKILQNRYKLIVITKGDLLDQERKLQKSNLYQYFDHIEILSDKTENHYLKLLKQLNIETNSFLMIGNSFKSDILPVLNIGGYGIHIPFHTTWAHEELNISEFKHDRFYEANSILEVEKLLI